MNHKYFILEKSCDPKIIGNKYPQCIGTLGTYNNDYKNNKSLYYFAHQKGVKIEYTPDLNSIVIGNKTKTTSLISCSLGPGCDIIVSHKFKAILESFTTSHIQFFDCTLHQNKASFEYYWIHFIFSLERLVDYENSLFFHPDIAINPHISNIKNYNNFIEFYNTIDTFGNITSKKIILNTKPIDFFIIGRFNQKIYVSEKLKNKIIETGLTGMEFSNTNDINFEY